MKTAAADDVRAAIAEHLLGGAGEGELGGVTLHPHQRDGLERVSRLLDEHGGALLADAVGLGKTFIALAAAREASDVLVVAPASLRDGWMTAADLARVAVRFVSVQMLSRNERFGDPDLIVIDEAHHLRNPRTRRFAVACALCRRAKVLLLSATPVQNRLTDLRTVLSLFLGQRAHAMSPEELARFIVRRSELDVDRSARLGLPRVAAPEWLRPVQDVDCLDRLFALPAPLPPMDGDDGGVLVTYTLVRQWASSRAALSAALRRRVARGQAMHDALLAGRRPTRVELAAWSYAEGAQQLAFPELSVAHEAVNPTALIAQVERHIDAVRELLAWLSTSPDPDTARAGTLRELLDRHRGERIIAFSEYADTVAALYRALAPTMRVAMLTHGGGRVAGGTVTRHELLERFEPGASTSVSASERIDLLLTTDVLSEGVNLQDASVVVHLDLAWNPARLEQRVGRVRRIGSARDAVAVYLFAPPAPAERVLGLERRLRVKLGIAARAVGVAGAILPGFGGQSAAAPTEDRIAGLVRRWRRSPAPSTETCIGAVVRASRNAALACVRSGGTVSLIAVLADRITDSCAVIEDLLANADGDDNPIHGHELGAIRDAVDRWLRRRVVVDVVNVSALHVGRARRTLLNRVDTIAHRTPRHAKPELVPLMRAARGAATVTLPAGAERVLDELARAPLGDHAWLQAIGEFAALHARSGAGASELLALLVLRTDDTPMPRLTFTTFSAD
jgi:hypothetical protein